MFSGKGDRFAKAECIGFHQARLGCSALGLVAHENNRRIAGTQPAADMFVERHDAGPRIEHEERDIGTAHSGFRLRAHPARQGLCVIFLETGRVDDLELEAEQFGIAFAPVARHARHIVDKRQPLANHTVEQGRLANIGPPDNRDDREPALFHDAALIPPIISDRR